MTMNHNDPQFQQELSQAVATQLGALMMENQSLRLLLRNAQRVIDDLREKKATPTPAG
jgi:hypothetical protein